MIWVQLSATLLSSAVLALAWARYSIETFSVDGCGLSGAKQSKWAVKYDTLGYKPQNAEIKYFLSDFCRLYSSRNRYTMRDTFKKSLLFMEAKLANSVAEAYRKNHTVEGYFQDSSAPDIDIDVGKVSIEDLRSAPYKATVDFYEIAYSPAEHVEVR
jgi:hypothetical protein